MPDYLNVWVRGAIMVSVPLKTEKQQEAARGITQGERDGEVIIFIEDKSRLCV